MNAAAVGFWQPMAPYAIAPAPSGIEGESSQTVLLRGRAKLSPSSNPSPSGSIGKGGQVRCLGLSTLSAAIVGSARQARIACEISSPWNSFKWMFGKRSASGQRQCPCGQVAAVVWSCGQPARLSICPYVGASCPAGSTHPTFAKAGIRGVWGVWRSLSTLRPEGARCAGWFWAQCRRNCWIF